MKVDRFTLQKAALALSLMIVINLFVYVGVINTFYPEPNFDNFCPSVSDSYEEETCKEIGGKWITSFQDEYDSRYGPVAPQKLTVDLEFKPYCDAWATCREEFYTAENVYKRNIFLVSVVLGTVALIAGIFFIRVSAISTGLLLSGLLLYFIGTVRFWSDMDDYLRLIVLTIVLVALIYVGYKKLNDRKEMSNQE
jgi:hypothetical protein